MIWLLTVAQRKQQGRIKVLQWLRKSRTSGKGFQSRRQGKWV